MEDGLACLPPLFVQINQLSKAIRLVYPYHPRASPQVVQRLAYVQNYFQRMWDALKVPSWNIGVASSKAGVAVQHLFSRKVG